jgi:hypothetical protein
MRIRSALAAAALALGLGLVAAAPASAHPFGPHWGHWGHWGGFGFGVADYGYGYDDDGCIRWRATFDRHGYYVGRRPVNVCD